MTRGEVLNMLGEFGACRIRYADEAERMQLLKARAECRAVRYEDGGKGSGGNRTEQRLVELCEYDAQLERKYWQLCAAKGRVMELINIVSGIKHREVLLCKYLYGWGYRRIARVTGCSASKVVRIHNEAVNELCRKCGRE